MANTSENREHLTNYQYMCLGQVISCSNMEPIALGYLNINIERIKQLKESRKEDPQGFVRDVIHEWACRRPENQVQNLACLLSAAAKDGYVDPGKIEAILGDSSSSKNSHPSQARNTRSEVTEDELQTIAEELRPYTADAMKIEVAPWIRDYVVNMDDLFTELSLEKIHNKPRWQETKMLKHYSELFESCKPVERPQTSSPCLSEPPAKKCRADKTSDLLSDFSLNKSDKILMKGNPGMGKTTQCKKISWDWAKKLFVHFQIVFFVFLKLVKPGDVIENVIIKQNPYMKGLNITEQKLRDILRLFGSKCLLILDGLDEHALGTNEDVLAIIRGEKYLKCSIIVTSRPHSTREIEQYFPAVVRVEGFTRNKAKQFASKILNDENLIEAVLNYNPENVDEKKARNLWYKPNNPIHKCPILLSFLCLLAREDDIDLLNTKMHTGEIYARMVRCLYKKYVIRKGLCYDSDEFEAAMTSIGSLALKTLLSGDPLLKRADVIGEIGEHAFDYGLLIGHEDFRLIWDETADIFVTFPHRSIQEFLGALYFIWMLDMGEEIQSLLGSKLIFLKNTLFLQFCLWFLCDGQRYFTLRNKHKVYRRMVHCCVELVNNEELDMKTINSTYPVLDISSNSVYAKDNLRVSFVGDILMKCNKASSLVLSDRHTVNQVLSLINPTLTLMIFIKHDSTTYRISNFRNTEISIWAMGSNLHELRVIMKHYKKSMNDPIVHLHLNDPGSLRYSLKRSPLLNVKTLHLSHMTSNTCKLRKTDKLITFSPNLTQLCLEDIRSEAIMKRVINKFYRDIFLKLNYLSLVNCHDMAGKLPVLIKSEWPNLQHFSLLDTPLSEDDLEFLCLACNGPKKNLPNLTSLCVTVPDGMSINAFCEKLFLLSWPELKKLFVDFKFGSAAQGLSNAIKTSKLPNLICLKIRMAPIMEALCLDKLINLKSLLLKKCFPRGEFRIALNTQMLSALSISFTDGLMGYLSSFIVRGFGKLNSLTLSHCMLNSEDLASLAQAKVNGLLPVLTSLDISHTMLYLSEFMPLFDGPCTWNGLLYLNIRATFNEIEDDQVIEHINEIVSRGYLPHLKKLGINHFETMNVHWYNLEKLSLTKCKDNTLHKIADAISWGYLPVLETVCVKYFRGHNAEGVRLLSQLGVSCHVMTFPFDNEFSSVKCRCET